jgi:phenylacetic acid degradation operon negative regulatory protein
MRKNIPIEKLLLFTIAATGAIGLVAIAPGLGLVLKQFGIQKTFSNNRYLANALHRLRNKGYIAFEGKDGSRRVRITGAGKQKLEEKKTMMMARSSKRAWDGMWRIVIFDIPEQTRKKRDALRRELRMVGFKMLQQSVWVTPDECEEYIKLLKADQHIGKSLIYIKTKDLEYSAALAKHFRIEQS